MAGNLSPVKTKHITATGAVTTDNVPGILYYVIWIGKTAGDSLIIKDGATTRFTLLIGTDLLPVVFEAPKDNEPEFLTDIDTTISVTTNGYATFIYRENT
jgi:hypothetical protein